jgi:hypothetical protein
VNRAKLSKALLLIVPANALLCALAWAVVAGHAAAPRRFEIVPMVLSMPGWLLAMLIWGYNSGESALSDALIVTANTVFYSMAEILLLRVGRAVGRCSSKEGDGA